MIKPLQHAQTCFKTSEHAGESVCPDGMGHQPEFMEDRKLNLSAEEGKFSRQMWERKAKRTKETEWVKALYYAKEIAQYYRAVLFSKRWFRIAFSCVCNKMRKMRMTKKTHTFSKTHRFPRYWEHNNGQNLPLWSLHSTGETTNKYVSEKCFQIEVLWRKVKLDERK